MPISTPIEDNNMKTDSSTIQERVVSMADDSRSTDGTHHRAPMVEARRRLAFALDSAKEACVRMQEKTVAGAKAADKAVREHPYHAMGLAAGLGALIGFLLLRRRRN
jgi:ElaB/YqjD/DUF883 family membrane-anchored ribosome-binding protein